MFHFTFNTVVIFVVKCIFTGRTWKSFRIWSITSVVLLKRWIFNYMWNKQKMFSVHKRGCVCWSYFWAGILGVVLCYKGRLYICGELHEDNFFLKKINISVQLFMCLVSQIVKHEWNLIHTINLVWLSCCMNYIKMA